MGVMMARSDWQHDIAEALRREDWALIGAKRVIKIVPIGTAPASFVGGYVTLAKFVEGKTPQQIESFLGLPNGSLSAGLRAYALARLPLSHEYEYDLTTNFPGGLYFNAAHHDPSYPPGAPHIHQWKIRDGVMLPVDLSRTVDVSAGQVFPRSQ
jgi:hypothetical protein